jgi:shikimate kinase / 3-dehydroquinate synthase
VLSTDTKPRRFGRAGKLGGASVLDERPSVALVGFMGAGKTSVGKALAARLGLTFVDLDEEIAEAAGASVPEIFREFGEVGFRARERAALRAVLSRRGAVVLATGGGTFADKEMRAWLAQSTRTVFLQASAETLMARLGGPEVMKRRPMLRGPDLEKTVRRLLGERAVAYQLADHAIATDNLRVEEVVDHIVRALRVERRDEATPPPALPPPPTLPFVHPVEVRAASGPWIAEAIVKVARGRHVAVISDTEVAALYEGPLVTELKGLGKTVSTHIVEPGERAKSFSVAELIYDELLEVELDREDTIVALGGGVIGDLAGFIAATFLRGVGLVHVPTTTLAVVDASLGGKNALNTERGKNLVGTIHMPLTVCVALSQLGSQPRRMHAAGLAEAVKMALTLDAGLFAEIGANARALLEHGDPLERVVRRCIELKMNVVAEDARDHGRRAILNFGHTAGHAIEAGESFEIPHGEAVALGMMAEVEWAVGERLTPRPVLDALAQTLTALGLPTDWRAVRVDAAAAKHDKKRVGTKLKLPIVSQLGVCEVRAVQASALVEYISKRSVR